MNQPTTASRQQEQPAGTDFERLAAGDHRSERSMQFKPYGSPDDIKLTVQIVKNLLCKPTKSGRLCSDQDATRFMMMCRARRLNPFEGDAFLVGYDAQSGPEFSLITAHQAFLKRAELHAEYDGMRSGLVVATERGQTDIEGEIIPDGAALIGAWAEVFFKTRKYPMKKRLPLAAYDKGNKFWEGAKKPGQMCKCAEADALRSSFPTMLGGLYLGDEIAIDVSSNGAGGRIEEGLVEQVKAKPEREPARAASDDDKAEAASGLAPEAGAETQEESKPPTNTPQEQLAAQVTKDGFSYPTFIACIKKIGSLKDADSFPDWNSIPSADCVRLLRGLQGRTSRPILLQQLAETKKEEM